MCRWAPHVDHQAHLTWTVCPHLRTMPGYADRLAQCSGASRSRSSKLACTPGLRTPRGVLPGVYVHATPVGRPWTDRYRSCWPSRLLPLHWGVEPPVRRVWFHVKLERHRAQEGPEPAHRLGERRRCPVPRVRFALEEDTGSAGSLSSARPGVRQACAPSCFTWNGSS